MLGLGLKDCYQFRCMSCSEDLKYIIEVKVSDLKCQTLVHCHKRKYLLTYECTAK